MKRILPLIVLAILLFGLFYWLNTKNYIMRYEEENRKLKNYIENIYRVSPYDFNITSLDHYNDSVYQYITERLSKEELQLIWYIPEKACQDCVIKEYAQLLTLPESMQNRIIIMTSFLKSRDVKMWINSHKYKYPVYNSTLLGISNLEMKNQLMLFLVNGSGVPSNFFILNVNLPEITDNYHKYVADKFEKEYGNTIYEETVLNDERAEIKVVNKHDFGEINQNEKVVTFFEFENSSSIPFIITNITTSCGCTVSDWDHKPANRGEKSKVKVEFSAKETGFFSKQITVFSNAKGSPHTLIITGNVKK